MCGIIGIVANEKDISYELYQGLLMLQHRGQDAAGIATYNGTFHLKKGIGLVTNVFNEKNLSRLKGNLGIGQVRYPTIGRGTVEDAQPFYINHPLGIAMVHNGNVTNFYELKDELYQKNKRYISSESDVEVILNVFADELEKKSHFDFPSLAHSIKNVFKRVNGAYSVIAMIVGKGLVAFKDPFGIRPLVIGKRKDAYGFASETQGLEFLGFEIIRDVKPGEVVYVDQSLNFHSLVVEKTQPRHCIFEWTYFARPDAVIENMSVLSARKRLGIALAKKCKEVGIDPDVVIPVPDTGRPAAITLANELNLPLSEGLIRNRYIARTFIMPTQAIRQISVREKLSAVKEEIKGKKVLLVDDSIVRGTTAREIVKLIKQALASKVYYGIYTSPIRYPCVYGIDMPTREEFIAKSHSISQIRKLIGADELIYQDYEDMVAAVKGNSNLSFCTACFNGDYPTLVTKKELEKIEKERKLSRERIGAD